jgi:hypothetical protein
MKEVFIPLLSFCKNIKFIWMNSLNRFMFMRMRRTLIDHVVKHSLKNLYGLS